MKNLRNRIIVKYTITITIFKYLSTSYISLCFIAIIYDKQTFKIEKIKLRGQNIDIAIFFHIIVTHYSVNGGVDKCNLTSDRKEC